MSKTFTSKIVGQLKPDDGCADWWKSEDIEIPFLDNQKLPVVFTCIEPENDSADFEEADQALANFMQLTIQDRNAISALAYKNCIDFLDATGFVEAGETFKQITNKDEIWRFIYPTEIEVARRHRGDFDIYITVACECEWEIEHGLQLVFKQGKKLTRISEQDGHLTEADAFGKPDEDDELLSKF